jgi:3-methyladenine DNA glycosylase AlkD
MDYENILRRLLQMRNQENVQGMERFGIHSNNMLGIQVKDLRDLAKEIGKTHTTAKKLWESDIHEARILASMVDAPEDVTIQQMETWAAGFDSWGVCDQVCNNLFKKTPHARKKALEWSCRQEEFIKRAGFTLMACLAVSDKKANDAEFERFLQLIQKAATDERTYVKKAVNWALRQIGKRNTNLNKKAKTTAGKIAKINSKPARWIASDALRELNRAKVKKRLGKK